MIEPIEEEIIEYPEESLEHKEEDAEKEPQSTEVTIHALVGYSNPQMMKVGGLLKQQPITILIDTGSTNNFLNSKVAARMTLHIEGVRIGAALRGGGELVQRIKTLVLEKSFVR